VIRQIIKGPVGRGSVAILGFRLDLLIRSILFLFLLVFVFSFCTVWYWALLPTLRRNLVSQSGLKFVRAVFTCM